MKRSIYSTRERRPGSIVVSIAVHVVVIALIASITFRYHFGAYVPADRDKTATERVQFVKVEPVPRQQVGNGSSEKPRPRKKAIAPAPLFPPTTIPTALPPIPRASASVGAVSGTATGSGGAPAGVATGVEPAIPDSRIELRPSTLRVPISTAERNDSAVQAIFRSWRDAEIAAEANRGRSPRDWTVERNGGKYGLDSQYIYMGKFKIPSAILAALPLNRGGVDGRRIIDARNADWIRNDIYTHSQGLSEDDFNAAVRRIRERKEREKKEQEDKDKASPKPTPIIP